MGVAMLGAWVYKVSHDEPVARVAQPAADSTRTAGRRLLAPGRKPEFVGRITGMADCRWADPEAAPVGRTSPLGRKYELGLRPDGNHLQTGAKVILQGPCTYEVDSAAGGFLSLGKLTAQSGERRGQRNQQISNQKSPTPQSPNLQIRSSALPPPSSPTWAPSSAWKSPRRETPLRTSSAAR